MGFKDLRVLTERNKLLYLILIIWLIIGITLFQFDPKNVISLAIKSAIITSFLSTCFLYFLISLILREKMEKYSLLLFIICFLISIPIWYFLPYSPNLVQLFIVLLFAIAGYFWMIISAVFSINDIYNKSVEWDDKIKDWSKHKSSIIRWGLFFGAGIISTMLLIEVFAILMFRVDGYSEDYRLTILVLSQTWLIFLWILFIIGIISLVFKKKYFWLGIYFFYVTFFAIYIMLKIYSAEFGSSSLILPLQITLYIFKLYLLFVCVSTLISEQVEIIAKKVKKLKSETILLFLLFSIGFSEIGGVIAPEESEWWNLYFMAIFFPFIALIFGIYAMVSYNKKHKTKNNELKRN